MRVLITNDDGIDSPGLTILANVAARAGHEVIVAAPNRQYSGYSSALTADDTENKAGYPEGVQENNGLLTSPGSPPGVDDGVESIAVHASPALIAYAAGLGAFGARPDLVLSGINYGPNIGPAVVHSGTVGAAMSAAAQGIPALAASISTFRPDKWDTANPVIEQCLAWLTKHPHDGRVLNVNIPDVPLAELRGLKEVDLATFGTTPDTVDDRVKHFLFGHLHQGLHVEFPDGTDAHELREGWATVSLLKTFHHEPHEAVLPEFIGAPTPSASTPGGTES